ncbi:uncharacterized protein LOC144441084 [Glandiceps talaboti]
MPVTTRLQAAAKKKQRESGITDGGDLGTVDGDKTNKRVRPAGGRKPESGGTKTANSSPNDKESTKEILGSKLLQTTPISRTPSVTTSTEYETYSESQYSEEKSTDLSESDFQDDSEDSDYNENDDQLQKTENGNELRQRYPSEKIDFEYSENEDSMVMEKDIEIATRELDKETERQSEGPSVFLTLGPNFYFSLIMTVLFFVGILTFYLFAIYPVRKTDHFKDRANVLDTNIKTLKVKYGGQSQRFWSTIHAPLRSIVTGSSRGQPAVIMIAGLVGTDTADNIARDVANSFPPSNGKAVEIDSEALVKLPSSDDAKEELDTLLESALGGESKTAVVSHIETLPLKALLIFYKYCDNENAPFKQSVIIMTVSLPIELYETEEQDREAFIEKFLIDSWKKKSADDISIDQISALFSRIANSVAITTLDPTHHDTGDKKDSTEQLVLYEDNLHTSLDSVQKDVEQGTGDKIVSESSENLPIQSPDEAASKSDARQEIGDITVDSNVKQSGKTKDGKDIPDASPRMSTLDSPSAIETAGDTSTETGESAAHADTKDEIDPTESVNNVKSETSIDSNGQETEKVSDNKVSSDASQHTKTSESQPAIQNTEE